MGDLSFCLYIAHSGLYPFGADGSEILHVKVKVTEVGSVTLKAEMNEVLETKPKNNIKWPNCCFMDWQAITREDVVHNKLQAGFLLTYLQTCSQSCETLHTNIQTCCFEVFYKSSCLQTLVPLSLLIATAAGSYCEENAEYFSFAFSHNFLLTSYLCSFSQSIFHLSGKLWTKNYKF